MEKAQKPPRKKAWKPKVKTGCITCRIRRVKCDEEKPHCNRCTSTGRKCDGYQEQPRSSALTILEPMYDAQGTSEEKQSFDFFRIHTAAEFAGSFGSPFWLVSVLQASHTHPAIRYAVTALGAMHRKYVTGTLPIVSDDLLDWQIRFALQQYNRSIQHLVDQPGTVSQAHTITILAACILFTCFASMQGYQSQAISHLRSGLRLLGEAESTSFHSRNDIQSHPVLIKTLRSMFTVLDNQARAMLADDELVSWFSGLQIETIDIPTIIKSLDEAREFMNRMFNATISFLQRIELSPPPAEPFHAVLAEHQNLVAQFAAGDAALSAYLAQNSLTFDDKQLKMVSSLNLYRNTIETFLGVFLRLPTHGEMAWDAFESEFESAVESASGMLQSGARNYNVDPLLCPEEALPLNMLNYPARASQRPFFSFGFDVVQPLFLVASRSRNPVIRRKAIALLLNFPRREGIWDSVWAARIACKCMALEEESSNVAGIKVESAADVPEEYRVREIIINYTGARNARVVYRTVGAWRRGDNGIEMDIAW